MTTIILTVAATLLTIYVIGFVVIMVTPRSSYSPVPRVLEAVYWPIMLAMGMVVAGPAPEAAVTPRATLLASE